MSSISLTQVVQQADLPQIVDLLKRARVSENSAGGTQISVVDISGQCLLSDIASRIQTCYEQRYELTYGSKVCYSIVLLGLVMLKTYKWFA